ncbi:hypothetical protein HanXRQr2_Chr08g0324801 [Helianthus annuus]|uniref:Uncharacterized protein n=1 Tax=Helianthus annuus TaxID=4232 RepID=A0A251U2Q2_HELAN|nr:hypothetical protein HanXRQr2_Chr08g0324801 [Helianthus annuus]KAJ0552441.1 hypothetical protein HanHA89_Chr08g0285271 [Helianthus annuus]
MSFSAGIWFNSCVPARHAGTNAASKTWARVRQFLHHLNSLFAVKMQKKCRKIGPDKISARQPI